MNGVMIKSNGVTSLEVPENELNKPTTTAANKVRQEICVRTSPTEWVVGVSYA